MTWHWFRCPECGATWGSTQTEPDREWCSCGTPEIPVPCDRPEVTQ